MTGPGTPFAADAQAALDAFSVPALSPGFADRVAAAAAQPTLNRGAPSLWSRRRERTRSSWRGRPIVGFATIVLVSAAAAAGGLFGDVPLRVPALATLIDRATAHRPVPIAVVPRTPVAPLPPLPMLAKTIPRVTATTLSVAPVAVPVIEPAHLPSIAAPEGIPRSNRRTQLRKEPVPVIATTETLRPHAGIAAAARDRDAGSPMPNVERQSLRERADSRIDRAEGMGAPDREAVAPLKTEAGTAAADRPRPETADRAAGPNPTPDVVKPTKLDQLKKLRDLRSRGATLRRLRNG